MGKEDEDEEEEEEEEEKEKKVNTSWMSSERRLQHRRENWDKDANNKRNRKSRLTDKVYGQETYQNVTACTILVNCIVQYRHLRIDIPLLVASLTVFHPSNGYQTTIRVRASLSVSFSQWRIFNPGK